MSLLGQNDVDGSHPNSAYYAAIKTPKEQGHNEPNIDYRADSQVGDVGLKQLCVQCVNESTDKCLMGIIITLRLQSCRGNHVKSQVWKLCKRWNFCADIANIGTSSFSFCHVCFCFFLTKVFFVAVQIWIRMWVKAIITNLIITTKGTRVLIRFTLAE